MTKKPEPLGDDAFNEIVAALSALGILFPRLPSRWLWHGS